MKYNIYMVSSADSTMEYGSTTRPYYISTYLVQNKDINIYHMCENPTNFQDNLIHYYQKNKKNKFKIINDLMLLYKISRSASPHILYPHQPVNALRLLPFKFLFNSPLIYDAHSAFCIENNNFKNRLIEKIILKYSNIVIAPSAMLKEVLIQNYNLNPDKIKIVENGVDTTKLYPESSDILLKDTLGINEDDKVIVFTCPRIETFPANTIALRYIFDLFPKIENRLHNIKLVIIGGGTEIDTPSENIIYVGYVQNLSKYINLADVCIAPYPSTAVCGGTRNKVADYFACGKVVVSTEEGISGFDDAMPDVHFLLAQSEDDFVSKIVQVLTSPDGMSNIGLNARDLCVKKYDWKLKSNEICSIMRYLLKNKT
ncbi:glycosyltransferase family 4 protein [Methanolobus vulcani]|uniref:Glycosyltransferase family 4 protein n=1 Tax=Methanolobus vulcani TaxID=38026 RepID=A0A7Z8KQ80_9EURY|nr:glycosyltransferase family 4 protein [Methanolobus vulcani]TQD27266.1 glycosyltransferase family 4 protein [Methanolobus vulcani]